MGERVATSRGVPTAARFVAGAVLACTGIGLCGCTAPRGPLVVTDPDPSVKIPAIKKPASSKDRKAVRQLVADLSNDDPAVRFYAINGLHRITGQRFGYDYFADDERRWPAVQKWQRWLETGTTNPGGEVAADAGHDR